jgi:hypothetical protein
VQVVLAHLLVASMAVLAVFVQLAVWGATKIRADGALLQSWQPYFGWVYGLAFAAVQLAICWWLKIKRGAVWLLRTWLIGGGLAVVATWIGGRGLDAIDSGVALIAGLSALVLAAALYDGRLIPAPPS